MTRWRLRSLAWLPLTLGMLGCQRGCLATWIADHDPARLSTPRAGGASPQRDAAATFDLSGIDCSDGLARCNGGQLEVSIAGHIPEPCVAPQERPGACVCAWKVVGACGDGCARDGLEVVAAEGAASQLCAAVGSLRALTKAESNDVAICAEDGVSCVDSVVRSCARRGHPAQLLGACVLGCAAGVILEPGDIGEDGGTAAILCRRTHAERQ